MRCTAKFAGAGLVLIAATACAGPQASPNQPAGAAQAPAQSSPSRPNPGGPEQPAQAVPDGSVPVPAGQIDASKLPAGYPHVVYTSRGGTVLSVKALEGGCTHASAILGVQNAQRVVVSLAETSENPHQLCTMDLRYPMVSVPLSAPLGQRTVALQVAPHSATPNGTP